jgi:hypothetical protein
MTLERPMFPDRRGFLSLAASAAVAGGAITPASALVPDPILEAIEAHRTASADVNAAIDDARWIESEQRLFDAQEEAILALVTIKPTTVAGLASLMRHVAAYEADGNEWPMFNDDEGDGQAKDFSFFLHRNLAAALERATQSN